MKKNILIVFLVGLLGYTSWNMIAGNPSTSPESLPEAAPEVFLQSEVPVEPDVFPELAQGEDYSEATSIEAAAEDATEVTVDVAHSPQKPSAKELAPAEEVVQLSALEQEIMEVLAKAHQVNDPYQRADEKIEANLDIQVRAALERKAINPHEVPQYRDYLRQLALEDLVNSQDIYQSRPAVSGIFADGSFVTEE